MWEGGAGGVRVPTSDPHTINACWFLFLLFVYLLVAEAASFHKKSYAGAIQLRMSCSADYYFVFWAGSADYYFE